MPKSTASVAIDGRKFKAVNNRNKNFTRANVQWRRAQLETADRRRSYRADVTTASLTLYGTGLVKQ
jgi:hypothetical protein